jgi:hypothetical protein
MKGRPRETTNLPQVPQIIPIARSETFPLRPMRLCLASEGNLMQVGASALGVTSDEILVLVELPPRP